MMSSLFTKVPVDEVLLIVEKRLTELRSLPDDPISEITTLMNKGLMKLLHHVLQQCFFSWQGTLYRQVTGLPMGGWLSPVLANLYMENLEYKVLCTAQ